MQYSEIAKLNSFWSEFNGMYSTNEFHESPSLANLTIRIKLLIVFHDISQVLVYIYIYIIYIYPCLYLTYGPRKAVAEVSNHNEPIGRKSGIQLVRKSMDFTFNCFVLS